MVLDNKKIPQEKNKIDTNFPNKQETNIQSENQQSQLDYVGFRPEVIPTETIQNPEQQNTVNTEQIKDERHIEIEKNLDSRIQTLKKKLKQSKKKNIQIPIVKDEINLKIEKIMEDGLEDAYKELTTIQQQEFKIKGEETAWKIRQVLKKTKVKIKEIFKLLLEWLKMLPGINKFFLEQEAKIKADKIISLNKFTNNK
ncbi:MAG: hypothetical protein COU28_03200 [Candidatus Magasanikbacteria bacterium CG10_big_fil_rev_8_21_14_0_10_36_16]|uniref:Uncharacterized protein n=1 Tax=Candidatus Magasanikbacteria bacterium CG10_big_fil_rev_8_21_14_0_10_36_16 TaxID=1974645 RepID=A0A2H0TY66_9BACT|nr:MAG: hypothetical protein COU28_03200 [Candidatus Magasanikbacteria bacterium CG10_big_fil_rev_8_21_14_0_10_36_16]